LGRARIGVGENSGLETMRASVRKLVSAADMVIMPVREETDDRISRERFDQRTHGSDADARVDQQRRALASHEPKVRTMQWREGDLADSKNLVGELRDLEPIQAAPPRECFGSGADRARRVAPIIADSSDLR
jgi:hypothetical protein